MKELVEISISIYPPGYRFQHEAWDVYDVYEGVWLTPENFNFNGYRLVRYGSNASDCTRELESWERKKYYSGHYLPEDMIFDRWGVRLRFNYPQYGVLINSGNYHNLEEDARNIGEEDVFKDYFNQIVELIDPYLSELDETEVNHINLLTLWDVQWHTHYSYYAEDDNISLSMDLIGIVKDLIVD